MKLPQARTSEIVVQNLNGEILVYDLANDKAFCLNDTSAIVFNACNEETNFAELAAAHQLTDEIIHLALDKLKEQDLLMAITLRRSPV